MEGVSSVSDLTLCNFCKFYELIGPAIKEHKKVEVKVDDQNLLPTKAARGVYIDGEFQAWFMEIPDRCICD
ncbi:hypothetical protein LCGC14_1056110 [marine sediment metagenome]|uniref:Uncharacterized protein n=1 Tax=marine sediment metagenome TaxID=412755 RepID=A0A0F9QTF4_9ZZZZ